MSCKVYVDVKVIFDKYGNLTPLSLVWQNGEKYDIDRILDIRPAASLKAGGMGIRYTCRIKNKQTFLFLEDNRWFVEAKL